MKFKRHLRRDDTLSGINMAPFIDMIFQLLIFFMLTSSFIFQPGIRVNLPRAITSEALGERNVVIAITAENLIYIDEKLVTINELALRLKNIAQTRGAILIKADEKASLGRVVKIWDLCRQQGIPRVNIATTQTGD